LAYGKMQLFYFSARKQQTEEEGERGNVYIDRDVVIGHRAWVKWLCIGTVTSKIWVMLPRIPLGAKRTMVCGILDCKMPQPSCCLATVTRFHNSLERTYRL